MKKKIKLNERKRKYFNYHFKQNKKTLLNDILSCNKVLCNNLPLNIMQYSFLFRIEIY
jgi:hypothetical protein